MTDVTAASRKTRFLRILLAIVIAGGILAVYFSPAREWMTVEKLSQLSSGLRSVWYGPLIFIGIYIVGAILFLPATLFTLAGALVWGWVVGGIYSCIGCTLGAVASFYCAKLLGQGVLERFKTGKRVSLALDRAGFQALVLLRLCGLIPYPIYNYAAGLTRIRPAVFAASTAVAVVPVTFVITYSADALFLGALTRGQVFQRILGVALVIGIFILVINWIKWRARRTLAAIAPEGVAGEGSELSAVSEQPVPMGDSGLETSDFP